MLFDKTKQFIQILKRPILWRNYPDSMNPRCMNLSKIKQKEIIQPHVIG